MTNEIKPFQLVAGHTVLDFINTLDNRFAPDGAEELLTTFEDFLRFAQEAGLISQQQAKEIAAETPKRMQEGMLAATRIQRETLARVFYAAVEQRAPRVADLEELGRVTAVAAAHRRLTWSGGGPRWVWPKVDSPALVAMLATEGVTLLTSAEMEHLRACAAGTCRWLFLDTSRNHTRRWCDMKVCGNRMKARRYYGGTSVRAAKG